MAKTRVALVLSGGTSAGAYIAGALDEMLKAFRASEEYEIDVVVGASAGATNAAAITQSLLYFDGETTLHDMWVEKVDIVELLAPDIGEGDPFSVLSPAQVRRLGQEVVNRTIGIAPVRAAFCAEDVTLAMTLANSTPLAYESRIKQPTSGVEERFIQDRNAEQEWYSLGQGVGPRDALWERIAMVAQASAAIPFVFPMVQLARRADGPGHYILRPSFEGERTFWYYDGGTYNNLPVDLVWYFVKAKAEREGVDPLANRKILVINPWRNDPSPPTSDPEYPDLLTFAGNILRDIHTESRTIQFDQEIVGRSVQAGPGESLLGALPGVDRPPVTLLQNFALVIPRVGDPPLRCLYLNALSAFFDRRFRQHDYRRGAADARRVAKGVFKIADYAEELESFYNPDAEPGEQDIAEYAVLDTIASTRDRRRSVRAVFEEALDARIAAIVKSVDMPGWDNALTDMLVTKLATGLVHEKLPRLWAGR